MAYSAPTLCNGSGIVTVPAWQAEIVGEGDALCTGCPECALPEIDPLDGNPYDLVAGEDY